MAGREALRNAAWDEARARFEEAAATSDAPETWEGLSRAAWWQGDQHRTLAARDRAYRAYRAAGDIRGAARMAMWLSSDHLDFRGDEAVASAWLRRGRELVRKQQPCSERGYITLLEADQALQVASDPLVAEGLAREALELARGIGDVGVEVVALAILGSALVASGAVDEGMHRLDECSAMAVGEDFAEIAAPGWALCHTVSACAEVGDFGRAEQWCRALHTWSAQWRARHIFGICRTVYGDVLVTGGDWSTAEEELLSALNDLRATRPALAGTAAIRLGRLRVRQGDTVIARSLFESALPRPHAILALGELDLASGDAAAATDSADRVLRRAGERSILDRFAALELLARARAVVGDGNGADAAATRMETEAARLATPYMRGRARMVRARVLSAAGNHDGARQAAEDATDLFTACSAPYEAADARLLLSSVLEALGRPERADAEARAARAARELLRTGARAPRAKAELTARETDILRLVAQGLRDTQIAGRLFLSPHTVHRHIANIRTKFDVPSRAAAVAHATREHLL
ncbi:helix-turn-helix domain-containing protein [Occultella kanbiaonis]|uniref:helix-turn-helix domain-containing protein n=1 Tax=Occultella kanbiaonis TaxID=2675754 RepID=UPI0013D66CE6|nr:helix-turn-helix transcriptional regulator [Occultella kanbiaonis]